MAYNEFTLDMLKRQFGLRTDERGDHFGGVGRSTQRGRFRAGGLV